jgi:ribose/xylose/arabinose/galactoside ABC-type transport system permease subunit
LPSLLVTLGFLFIYRGLVAFATKGFSLTIPDELRDSALIQLLGGKTMDYHNAIGICVGLLLVVSLVLAKTRFGSHLYAVGGDIKAAIATGVSAGRVKILAFMVSAGLAGFAGIIAACTLSSVSPTTAEGLEFEAIAAAVIGGCALRGGAGTAWGAVLGVATLMALKAGLILIGLNIFIYQIMLGALVVALVAVRGAFPRLFAAR